MAFLSILQLQHWLTLKPLFLVPLTLPCLEIDSAMEPVARLAEHYTYAAMVAAHVAVALKLAGSVVFLM